MPSSWTRRSVPRPGGEADGDLVRNTDARLTDARPPVDGSVKPESFEANAVKAGVLAAFNMEPGKYLRSTDYVAGTTGWSIDADGRAEFNALTVRGVAQLQDGATNMDADPSYEAGGVGVWSNGDFNSGPTNNTVQARTGTKSVSFQTIALPVGQYHAVATLTGLVVGRTYRLTIYIKTSASGLGSVEIIDPAAASFIWGQSPSVIVDDTAWRAVQLAVYATATSQVLRLYYDPQNAAAARTIYLDDIVIAEASTLTAGTFFTNPDFTGLRIGGVGAEYWQLNSSGVATYLWGIGTQTVNGDLRLEAAQRSMSTVPEIMVGEGVNGVIIRGDTVNLSGQDTASFLSMDSDGAWLDAGSGDLRLIGTITRLTGNVTDDVTGPVTDYANLETAYGGAASWTAATTNPTNRIWAGFYTRFGKVVHGWVFLTANTSFTAGSGAYIIALPVAVDTGVVPTNAAIGTWVATIAGANTAGVMRRQGTDAARFSIGAGGSFGSAQGMTATDTLSAFFSYIAS